VAAGDLLTADGQFEWRGTLLGTGTMWRLDTLTGWLDLPDFRGDDQPRPSRHGAFPNASLMSKRVVQATFKAKGTSLANFPAGVAALQTRTAPTESPVEEPLVIQLGGAKWLCNARLKKRVIGPVDKRYAVGYATLALQWEATDPKLYSPALHTLSTGLASAATTGLPFPLVAPLDFGSGPIGGFLNSVTNAGWVASWPQFSIAGPVTGPVITNHDTGERLLFNPSFVVTAGQTLTIDTDLRQVALNGVQSNGQLFTRNWFPLLPGVPTRIDFAQVGTYDPAALLTVSWRDAAA
jgi:hypothetical protein